MEEISTSKIIIKYILQYLFKYKYHVDILDAISPLLCSIYYSKSKSKYFFNSIYQFFF